MNSIRKTIAVMLIASLMLLTFSSCTNHKKEKNTKKNENLIRVAIINNDPNESGYRVANDLDMTNTFTEENGYDASFSYSIVNSEQIMYANQYIEEGVEYLLLSPANTSGWEETLAKAKEAGTKVILFDRTVDADESLYEASIISDMRKEGDMATEWLKNQNLDTYNIIHIQGVEGSSAQEGRSEALFEMAEKEGWNIVVSEFCDWNAIYAQNLVEKQIKEGKKFNVIYAENDDMAKGAVKALDNAGISHGLGGSVIIMGFDCNRWALEELLSHEWNYDGQCNPYQAKYIDQVIKKLENGETIEDKTIYLEEKSFDAETITPEDIELYGI